MSPTPSPYQPVLINCGGFSYVDQKARLWVADDDEAIFSGGTTNYLVDPEILGTPDTTLYRSERIGTSFAYDIPVPEGNYEIILHFCELDDTANATTRVFDVAVEDTPVFTDVDIFELVGARFAMTLETVKIITDGSLSIAFSAQSGVAQISAIEVNQVGPHLAHAVAGTCENCRQSPESPISCCCDAHRSPFDLFSRIFLIFQAALILRLTPMETDRLWFLWTALRPILMDPDLILLVGCGTKEQNSLDLARLQSFCCR